MKQILKRREMTCLVSGLKHLNHTQQMTESHIEKWIDNPWLIAFTVSAVMELVKFCLT